MKTIFSFFMMMFLMVGASFAGSASANMPMPTQTSISAAVPSEIAKEEKGMSKREQRKALKEAVKQMKSENPSDAPSKGLLILLAILIPFVAVGLVTDWDVTKVIIALLLTCLFWLPGIIYAIIQVNKNA